MRIYYFCFLFLIIGCSSTKQKETNNAGLSSSNTSPSLQKMFDQAKASENSEVPVVSKKQSLQAKRRKYGLSDFEAAELKYLEQNRDPREAELQAKKDVNGFLSNTEEQELLAIQFGPQTMTNSKELIMGDSSEKSLAPAIKPRAH